MHASTIHNVLTQDRTVQKGGSNPPNPRKITPWSTVPGFWKRRREGNPRFLRSYQLSHHKAHHDELVSDILPLQNDLPPITSIAWDGVGAYMKVMPPGWWSTDSRLLQMRVASILTDGFVSDTSPLRLWWMYCFSETDMNRLVLGVLLVKIAQTRTQTIDDPPANITLQLHHTK